MPDPITTADASAAFGSDSGAPTAEDAKAMQAASPSAGPLTEATNDLTPSEDPDCYKAAVTVCALEKAILRLTNAHRDATSPLSLETRLSFAARAWSLEQLVAGAIGHAGFPAEREATYAAEFNVPEPYFLAAENVGITAGTDQLTVEQIAGQIVDMWWSSAAHRANILGPYGVIGIGVSLSNDARTVVATQLFASP
jgi:uncharacterized protein YkwD